MAGKDTTALTGMKSGKRDELTMLYTVRPGHEQQMRAAIREFYENPFRQDAEDPRVLAVNTQIGVHDVRHVLFDNDTRLAWLTSFDTEWDPYIDDTFAVPGATMTYARILQHTNEAPPDIMDPNTPYHQSSRGVKDIFIANRVIATGFFPTFPNITVREVWKGERLRRAFEEVLNNPEAEQALSHPALKPLLDLAAE